MFFCCLQIVLSIQYNLSILAGQNSSLLALCKLKVLFILLSQLSFFLDQWGFFLCTWTLEFSNRIKNILCRFLGRFRCIVPSFLNSRLPWWHRWQRICLQYGRPGFDSWVGKIPWGRELPTPVFWPGEFHGQRSLAGYTVHGVTKSWTGLSNFRFHFLFLNSTFQFSLPSPL